MSVSASDAWIYDIIVSPVVTEKSYADSEKNKYHFNVTVDSDKTQIKTAIEKIFDVEVSSINVINRKGKVKRFRGHLGRRKDTKRAIVTLKEGSKKLDFSADEV